MMCGDDSGWKTPWIGVALRNRYSPTLVFQLRRNHLLQFSRWPGQGAGRESACRGVCPIGDKEGDIDLGLPGPSTSMR